MHRSGEVRRIPSGELTVVARRSVACHLLRRSRLKQVHGKVSRRDAEAQRGDSKWSAQRTLLFDEGDCCADGLFYGSKLPLAYRLGLTIQVASAG